MRSLLLQKVVLQLLPPPCELGRVHVDVPSPMVVGGLGGQVRVDLTTLALFDLVGSADVTVPVMTMTP
jgi:hypothetical protein